MREILVVTEYYNGEVRPIRAFVLRKDADAYVLRLRKRKDNEAEFDIHAVDLHGEVK